jgi:restriction endonuclease S subunit
VGKRRKAEFLEIKMQYSIVDFCSVKNNSDCIRIDAEFFQKEYLEIESFLKRKPYNELKNYGIKIYHPKEIERNYVENEGVLFLRAQNVRPFAIDAESNKVYISQEDANKLKGNFIGIEDILITRTGANFGQCDIYLEREKSVASSHTFIMKSPLLSPYFLTVFFNTIYGRKLIDKGMYGATQQEIAPYYLYHIPLPLLSHNFTKSIENIYKKSHQLTLLSREYYSQAEQILLSELGLLDWKPKHQLWFVRNYSDAKSAERIDAEYFQPMYEEIIEKNKKYKEGYDLLGDIVKIKDRNFIPKDDVNYKYIELANISTNGNITGCIEALGKELPTRARLKVNSGDVIVSSIEGSLSSIALINENFNNALCSTGFFVINSEIINSETLLVLMKSLVGQLQLKKRCSGTILTAINRDEFSKIILPKLSDDIQSEIKAKITDMYNAKALSKNLLEIAKRGVEIAIEKDEVEAEKWINEEFEKLLR